MPTPLPRRPWTALLVLLAVSLAASPGGSHERATTGVDGTATVVVGPEGIDVLVELRLGEFVTVAEAARLDPNGDGRVSDEERARYEEELGGRVRGGVSLAVQGVSLEPWLKALRVSFPLGPVGLPELAARAHLVAPWPAGVATAPAKEASVDFGLALWQDSPGHRKIVVTGHPTGSVRYRVLRAEREGPHATPVGATIRYAFPTAPPRP